MTDPAYHLRPNKAADRLALMEAVRRLGRVDGKGLKGYTYHGLGGPYLEDFRLMHESWPDMRMVSIEKNEETLKRQKFHRPFRSIRLENKDLSSFVTEYDSDKRGIFWFDYTKLERSCFTDFQRILMSVAYCSMIKVTLHSDPDYFRTTDKESLNNRGKSFLKQCRTFMRRGCNELPDNVEGFASLLQEMIKIAAQDALPYAPNGGTFVPVSSFFYSDGAPMFTLTGVVCRRDERGKLEKAFEGWELANLEWKPPMKIKVPPLSTKERLHLQPSLPTKNPETVLPRRLGYLIEDNLEKTKEALKQYATFDRYEPYFLKGVP